MKRKASICNENEKDAKEEEEEHAINIDADDEGIDEWMGEMRKSRLWWKFSYSTLLTKLL